MSIQRNAPIAALVATLAVLSACSSDKTTTTTTTISTGTVTATLKTAATGGAAVVGATVATTPDVGATCAPSDSSGNWSCALPTGVYTLTFSGTGVTRTAFTNVTVIVGQTTTLTSPGASVAVIPYSPIALSIANPPNPAGFNTLVNLSATATGGNTAGYVYTWKIARAAPALWGKSKAYTQFVRAVTAAGNVYEVVTGGTSASSGTGPSGTGAAITDGTVTWRYLGVLPAAPTLTGTGATASFTTEGFDPLAVGSLQVRNQDLPNRPGPVGITVGDAEYMAYNVTLSVSDGTYSQNASATVMPASFNHGSSTYPVGAMVVVTDGDANAAYASYSWSLTGKPNGSGATLHDGSTKYPWFIADVAGEYTVDNAGVPAWQPSYVYTTGNYVRANGATYKFSSCSSTCTSAASGAGPSDYGTVVDGTVKWAYQSAYAPIKVYADTFSGVAACGTCHGSGSAGAPTAQYTAWQTSAHIQDPDIGNGASLFQNELAGLEHGGGTCLRCHTTGNDPGEVGNNGFSDRAIADGWTYPATTVAWSTVPANLKELDGVQCESCHGPVGILRSGSHKPAVSWSASVCGRCHDYNIGSHHDRYSLWSMSPTGHSLRSLAQRGAADKSLPSSSPDATTGYWTLNAASCARCHTAQGFAAYVKQQLAGGATDDSDPCSPSMTGDYAGNVKCNLVPNQDVTGLTSTAWTTYLTSTVGLTAAQVEPQTCQACHDAHTTGLRLEDDTHVLPSGFRVRNAGAGALCMLCHNSRNGARGDAITLFPKVSYKINGTNTAIRTVGTPHDSTAADVFAGKNLFFTDGYVQNTGKHLLYVQDTCVGCHVNIDVGGRSIQTKAPNHAFTVDDTICATCHSNATTLTDATSGIAAQFDAGQAAMSASIGQAYLAMVTRYQTGSQGNVLLVGGSGKQTADFPLSNIASVAGPSDPVAGTSDSQVLLTFSTPVLDPSKATGSGTTTTTYKASLTDDRQGASLVWKGNDQNGTANAGRPVVDPAGLIQRAVYNNALLARDFSHGVHNWSYAQNALVNTKARLDAYTSTAALPAGVTAP